MAVARLGIVDEVEGDFDATAGLGGHFFLDDGHASLEGIAHHAAKAGGAIENFAHFGAEDAFTTDVEEALAGAGDEDRAGIAGEQHDAVLQIGEDLIEILAECGEDFFDVADALAEALDFSRDLGDSVVAPAGFPFRGGGSSAGHLRVDGTAQIAGGRVVGEGFLLRGKSIEAMADLLQGLECEVGDKGGDDHGDDHGEAHEAEGLDEPGLKVVAEEGGSDADADGQERPAIEVETGRDVVDLGWAEDDAQGADEELTPQNAVVGTPGKDLIVEGGIGNSNDGPVLPIDDGDVEDGGRVVDDGSEQGVEAGIASKRVGGGGAYGGGIVGVDLASGEGAVERPVDLEGNLVGEDVVGIPGLLDMLLEQLAEPDPGEDHHDAKDQAGDGKDEFGLEAHGRGGAALNSNQESVMGAYRECSANATFYSSRAPAVAAVLPYSRSLLWRVLRLIPRISAARVLLLWVDSRVLKMSMRSASSTVAPTSSWMALGGSSVVERMGLDPKPGGRWRDWSWPSLQRTMARSMVLRSSRTLPGQSWATSRASISPSMPVTRRWCFWFMSRIMESAMEGMSSLCSRGGGRRILKTLRR